MSPPHRSKIGEELARRLAAALRGAQLYAPDHPIVKRNVGALAETIGGSIVITGIIISPDAIDVYKGDHEGKKSAAAAIGKRLAIDLLDQGGDKVVRRAKALFDS